MWTALRHTYTHTQSPQSHRTDYMLHVVSWQRLCCVRWDDVMPYFMFGGGRSTAQTSAMEVGGVLTNRRQWVLEQFSTIHCYQIIFYLLAICRAICVLFMKVIFPRGKSTCFHEVTAHGYTFRLRIVMSVIFVIVAFDGNEISLRRLESQSETADRKNSTHIAEGRIRR